MTAPTEVSTITPPVNYPADDWLPEGDYFFVPPELRGWYADDAAGPSPHQRQRLHQNVPMPGGGPIMVDQIVIDGNGRHVKADPRQLGQAEARGLLGRYRPVMVKVDPDASTDTMAHRVWEHDIRLQAAQRAANVDATYEHHHQVNLVRACPICSTANPAAVGLPGPTGFGSWSTFAGRQYCDRCLSAIQLEVAQRHQQRYRQQIDQLLGDLPEWQPRPPERGETQVSQRW
jgi:hypothetical protein